MDLIQTFGEFAFVAAIFGGFVCWFVVAINMFRTVANRKPGVPLFPNWWESPFNILFRPSQLTETGLSARRWCFYGGVGFLACWALGILVGLTTGSAN